jgi:hypothetical protein
LPAVVMAVEHSRIVPQSVSLTDPSGRSARDYPNSCVARCR